MRRQRHTKICLERHAEMLLDVTQKVLANAGRHASESSNKSPRVKERIYVRHSLVWLAIVRLKKANSRRTPASPPYICTWATAVSIHTARRHPHVHSPMHPHTDNYLPSPPMVRAESCGFQSGSSWTRKLLRLLGVDFYMGKPIDLNRVLGVKEKDWGGRYGLLSTKLTLGVEEGTR